MRFRKREQELSRPNFADVPDFVPTVWGEAPVPFSALSRNLRVHHRVSFRSGDTHSRDAVETMDSRVNNLRPDLPIVVRLKFPWDPG
jgi:hypothetical protein